MNVTSRTDLVRKALTGIAVAAVAATCLVSTATSVSATATHRSDVTSATKEWKGRSNLDVVSATKEWKASTSTAPMAPATKEW